MQQQVFEQKIRELETEALGMISEAHKEKFDEQITELKKQQALSFRFCCYFVMSLPSLIILVLQVMLSVVSTRLQPAGDL